MCIDKNIRLVPIAVLLAVALNVCVALPAQAQEVAAVDSVVTAVDSVVTVVDTVAAEVDSTVAVTPEWYVEPVIPEAKRAPRHAKAAKCSLDSTLSFDVDSVLIEVSAFQYDDADRVTSKTVYSCNPDGSRVGTFKEDYGFDANGTQVMTAVYAWVSATSSWKGTEKTEFAYDGELMIQRIDYAWVNEAWVADKKFTWKYDEQERVIEYYEYSRDKNTNELVYSKGRIQEWDSEDRQITDIQYTAYSNGAWTAGTKKEWEYDTNGNKTVYIYYAGLTKGNWGATGSTRELWTYDESNTKTKYEKYTWSNGWVGSVKEEWGYTDGKQTMYAKYSWSNGDWVGVSKEEWNYVSGKQTLYAKYTWQNGAWVGVSKEEWAYTSAGKDKRHEKFTWSNGAWQTTEREDWTYDSKGRETLYEKKSLESGALVIAAQRNTTYDASGNKTFFESYQRKNGALVGVSKETWVYISNKMTKHNTFVWSNGDWTDSEEEVWAYSGSNKTNYEKYVWTNGVKTGVNHETWAYTSGNVTEHITFVWSNGDWENSKKEEMAYTSGKKTLHINSTWENGAWVNSDKEVWAYTSGKLTLNEKYEWENGDWSYTLKEVWAYDGSNQTLHEKYNGENGALVGEAKEEWEYTSGKNTLHATYAWFKGDWVVSGREGYDLADNQTLIETYTITATSYKGSKKEEYTFNAAGKMTDKYVYKWNTSKKAWVYNTWTVSGYDAAGNKTETCKYTWKNDMWKGSGSRELVTYNSDKKETEHITQEWSSDTNDWLNETRTTATYSNGLLVQEADFTWDGENWMPGYQRDYYFDAAGQNYLSMTIKFNGADWVNVSRTEITYNADGEKILTKNDTWKGEKWVTTSMEKMEIVRDDANRLLLNASWKCSSDLVWIGVKKDTFNFSPTGKLLFEGHYNGWAGNDWVPNYTVEWKYDEADHEILNQRFDWEGNAWIGHFRYEHEYDEQGHEIMKATYLNWITSTSSWRGSTKYSYAYDASGRKTNEIIYQWGPNGWEYFSSHTYQFDASGREIYHISQLYDEGVWINNRLYVKEYKGLTLIKDNSYSWVSGAWLITNRNEWYYDADAQAKLRREVVGSWDSSNGAVLSFTHNWYSYACDPHYFTIRFVDEDGTELESNKVKEGEMPVYGGETPTKAADAQYTYTFKGWDKAIVAATAHATYTATYTKTTNKYTITFLNDNGATIESKEWEYGATPTCDEPTKEATEQYVYTFAGWNPSIATVTGEATYTATFTTAESLYTITWVDGDGKTLKTEKVAYGETPAYTGATPTKSETAQYTYAFNNTWQPAIVAVTTDATYTAQFGSTVRSYTITYVDEADEEIDQEILAYGTMPEPETPTKTSTAQYTYTFDKWIPALAEVTGDATYKASFTSTLKEYTITWKDGDGKTLQTGKVAYGNVPAYSGDTPTKTSTAQYSYTFTGWDKTPVAVTANATYTAQFSQTVNKYTITFKNDDGTTLEAKQWEYGKTPTCAITPTKAATAEFEYEFDGWTPEVVAVTGAATYTAKYKKHLMSYTITFLNDDGSLYEDSIWDYGCLPLLSEEPTKAATAQYTYTFAGWTPEITNVTGAATYTATYTSVVNKYTVTWLNDDNTLIDKTIVEYGIVPTHEDATKAATAEFTYTFTGWDNTPVAVTGDATYKATFSATKNKYTITWVDGDGETLKTEQVAYGETPAYAGETPTKAETAQYTYEFNNTWTPEIESVTGDATYTAQFTSIVREYTITWVDGDGETLKTEQVAYGETPAYAGETPTKTETAQYTYEFNNTWSPEIVAVAGDATYTAQFASTVREYTITWVDGDGEILKSEQVAYGESPAYAGDTPTKTETAQYTYEFNNTWSPEIVAVEGDATYTAQFTSTVREYTITWVDGDGETLKTEQVAYGETPVYAGETPTKTETAQYTYEFNNAWSPEIVSVAGDATYTAQFTSIVREYTITWVDGDGETLKTEQVAYGETPVYAGETPTKTETAQYTYEFNNTWSPEIVAVAGDATYTAQFTSIVREYTITWVDGDGEILKSEQVAYGETPAYAGETPTKTETAQYTYEFNNTWTPEIESVTGDATYTAQFTSIVREYTITWVDGDGKTLKSEQVAYGETPAYAGETPTKTETAQYTYEFNNTWSPEIESVTGDATYTAQFTDIVREYTITWVDGDGKTLKSEQVAYGETPVYAGETPTKTETAQYTYEFNNTWTPEIESVTGDATYTAQFTSIVREYTITWVDGDGETLKTEQVAYGETPAYAGDTPTKTETAQYAYEFNNTWSPEIVAVAGDATYTAQFASTVREYTITWVDGDGEILKSEQVAYGESPAYAGDTPTKTETAQYTYEFNNTWTPEIESVTGDATYTAQFTSIVREYTITWVDGDGETLKTEQVAYGETPAYAGDTPTKTETAQYAYEFNNTWSPEIVAVEGDATYTGQFTSTVREYTITWVDGDGETLKTEQVAYGETPVYAGETPTKTETAQYTYEFNNAWSPEIVSVAGDATYTAQFTSIVREYTITWVDGDGETLKTEQVAYGETPVYAGETPTKTETAQYTYEFNNTWTPEIESVTGDATYTAQFTSIVREYTITWVDGDGETLKTEQVAYGETPVYAGETPTKTETAQYTYEFNNTWSPEIVAVEGDATYTAQFASTVREYTITWVDGDGETLKTEQVAYGETPEYAGETPTKAETAQYTYEFNNTWSPEIVSVTGDATYTAQFESILRMYTITVTGKGWSEHVELPYGTDLTQLVQQLLAIYGNQYEAVDSIYTLTGWTPELQTVTEDATYEALYTAEVRTYTITWLDEDGTLLDEQEVDYGTMPEYAGETPTKEEDEIYTYTFSGWNPEMVVVSGDATYVATYAAEVKPNTAIGDITTDEPAVKVIENDLLYIIRGGMKWAVQGARVK